MGRMQDIAAGTRAIKRVSMPLVNVSCDLLPAVPALVAQRARDRATVASVLPDASSAEPQSTIEVGLRVLTGAELAEVLGKATLFARARGVDKPDEENPIYNLGMSVYTIAVACVDPDSDPAAPRPFFGILGPGESWTIELAAQHILTSPHLGRDGIMWLSEQHEYWQDQTNPGALKMSPDLCWRLVGEVAAEEAPKAYWKLRPAARWSFTHFMAVLLSSSLTGKLPSGFTLKSLETAKSSSTEPTGEQPS